MMLIAMVLVAAGLALAGAGLARTRMEVVGAPGVIDVALGAVEGDPDLPDAGFVYRALEPLLQVGASAVRRLSPASRLQLTRDRIVWAGLEGRLAPERILAAKAAAALVFLMLGFLVAPAAVPRPLFAGFLAFAASFVPDVWLDSRARERQTLVARALPDALDLLAITVEAGLGLEQAIAVVSESVEGPLADELNRFLREVELGVSRRDALGALRRRTNVPELSSFVVALVQADEMGMAVGHVLKTQAAQVRLKRRQHAREQAAKTPVKILFPVIFGIFPAIFVVSIGPGIIRVSETLF